MGRAIALLSLLVLCSFAAVLLHLSLRRPSAEGPRPPQGAPQMLQVRADGTVYSISLQISRLEDRLMEEEKRSLALQSQLHAEQEEREVLRGSIASLHAELRRLRERLESRDNSVPPDPAVAPGNPITPGPPSAPGEENPARPPAP